MDNNNQQQKIGIPLYNAADPAIVDGKIGIQAMVEKIELFSTADSYGTPYDITNVVTELEITESIHFIAVVGSITIIDEMSFFQDARIHGQEKLRIRIRRYSITDPSYSSIVERVFLVTNLRDFVRQETKTIFTLEFASPHVFKDKTKRISRAYGYTNIINVPQGDLANSAAAYNGWKQKYSEKEIEYGDIFEKTGESAPSSFVGMSKSGPFMMEYPELFIYDILRRDLGLAAEDVWLYGYDASSSPKPSAEKMKVIIPNWRPFQAIKWLLRNTFSTKGAYVGHPWFCYDTFIAGIRIEPYSILVKKYDYSDSNNTSDNEIYSTGRTIKEMPEKFVYNPLFSVSPESSEYYKLMHQKIFELELGLSFNTFDKASKGAYASLQNYVDVFSKWVLPNPVYPIENTLLKYEDHIVPGKDTISSHYKPYSGTTLDLVNLNETNYTYFIAYNSALHGTVENTLPYNKPFGFAGTSSGGLPGTHSGMGTQQGISYTAQGTSGITPSSYNGINPSSYPQSSDVITSSTNYTRTADALGISQEEWDTYRRTVAQIESSGSGGYAAVGGSNDHYMGAYQMGSMARADAARILGIPPPSVSQFLADPDLQERMLDAYTYANHTYMLSNDTYRALPPQEQIAILGYGHNSGHGPAKTYLNTGSIHADGFGTKSIVYYNAVMGNFSSDSTLATPSSSDSTTTTTATSSDSTTTTATTATSSDSTTTAGMDYTPEMITQGIMSQTSMATQQAMNLRGGTLQNGCAAYASSMYQLQGFNVQSEVGAQNLANQLESAGWERVPIGQQQPGDMGVTADHGQGAPGADHVYIVTGVDPNNPNVVQIVDNQLPNGGARPIQGGGKTPTEYFLRPPYGTDQQSAQPMIADPTVVSGSSSSSLPPSSMIPADPAGLGKLGRTGDMLRRNMSFMCHTIKILGDFKINPGTVIYIEIPKSIDPQLPPEVQGLKENSGIIDEYLSGQYFVTECTHSFKNKMFYSYVTINRDSSCLDLESSRGLGDSNQQIVDTTTQNNQTTTAPTMPPTTTTTAATTTVPSSSISSAIPTSLPPGP